MNDAKLIKTGYSGFNRHDSRHEEHIAGEYPVTISANGIFCCSAMIFPSMLEDYAAGALFLRGIINSADDISDIQIDGLNIEIKTSPGITKRETPRKVGSSLSVSRDDIFRCVQAILESDVFSKTEAVHSAGLFSEGSGMISIAEDIGRHTAMDKAIGAALLRRTDFSRVMAVSTGRQPAEMITKYIIAGIPVIATKGVPTSMAVKMADEAGITIAGLVRRGTMTVYTHPGRIM